MTPSCFSLTTTTDGQCSLYLGEVSTIECLQIFEDNSQATLIEFSANGGDQGWLGKEQMPSQTSILDWRKRLSSSDFSLIDFTAEICGISLSTHDDSEGHFVFPNQESTLKALQELVGQSTTQTVFPVLLSNQGRYITCQNGRIAIYDTFDSYLAGA